MSPLNLPEYQPRIKQEARTEIFCLIRKKWVSLTPEEWVRQHFLNLLVEHFDYPKGMIRLEHSMKYFKNLKRSDVIVFDQSGEVFLLLECKSHEVKLNEKVVKQAAEYNKVMNSKYLVISNGMKHFVWKRSTDGFVQMNELPRFQG